MPAITRKTAPVLGTLDTDKFGVATREKLPVLNSYDERVQRAHMCFERQQKKVVESLQPQPLLSRLCSQTPNSGTRVTGRQRLANIRKALKSLGLTFSDDQREFHNRMIAACAKLIFKDDLEANLSDLLTELGIEELRTELMAIMPRRYGKTVSVAAMVVALAFAIEGIEISIFSTGRRASQKFLEQVYYFMCKLGGLNIIKHNVETIWIQGPMGQSDIRKVSSYPSSVRISSIMFFVFCFGERKRKGG